MIEIEKHEEFVDGEYSATTYHIIQHMTLSRSTSHIFTESEIKELLEKLTEKLK